MVSLAGKEAALKLNGKTALVTGAGHRLGREIALALGRRGCDTLVHYHAAAQDAAATRRELEDLGVGALAVQADLRDADARARLFDAVDRWRGGLDLLVNSAAVLEPVALLEADEAAWSRTIDLNLTASFFCLQHAARRMQARGGGAIVNLSDVAGLSPWPRFPVHSISKAGVEMLTRVAAVALAPAIRVNAVAPGPVLKPQGMPDSRWQQIGAALPLGRPGAPADVVEAVLFLLENDFITGETLVVDGGNLLP